MKKSTWILGGALVVSAIGVTACDGDDSNPTLPTSDAGADATATRDSGPSTDAAPGTDSATDDGATTDGAAASDAGDAATAPQFALFVGTNFKNAELSVVSLDSDSVAGNLALNDQDSVPDTSGGLGFVLERGLGDVVVLDHAQPWTASKTIAINDTADAAHYASNPHAVVVTTGTKAYVARYSLNTVKIIDVAAGTTTGSIDFSSFVAADDTDATVEVTDGAYDATTKRAYFLLERIDNNNYPLTCITSHGLIVAVDATTDAIVDLNGAATGQGIDLLGFDPGSLVPDFANGRFLVTNGGCLATVDAGAGVDGGTTQAGQGIESVTIATAASTWLYQPTGADSVGGFVFVDETHAFLNDGTSWFTFNATTRALGTTAIANFPSAPVADSKGRIVGLSAQAPDAGSDAGVAFSVVAFDVATSQVTTIVKNPFKTVSPDPTYGIASAILQ